VDTTEVADHVQLFVSGANEEIEAGMHDLHGTNADNTQSDAIDLLNSTS
jgi:hypothetical protein